MSGLIEDGMVKALALQVKAAQNMTGDELASTLRAVGFTVHADVVDRVLAENAKLRKELKIARKGLDSLKGAYESLRQRHYGDCFWCGRKVPQSPSTVRVNDETGNPDH